MTTDREAAEWVARTYPADAHPTVAALAAAYLRTLALCSREGFTTWDQDDHLGAPPWRDGPALAAWEAAHGHDARTKCYAEYGCQLYVDPEDIRDALDLTRRGCPRCGALIPNDMARCALCGWPTEVTP